MCVVFFVFVFIEKRNSLNERNFHFLANNCVFAECRIKCEHVYWEKKAVRLKDCEIPEVNFARERLLDENPRRRLCYWKVRKKSADLRGFEEIDLTWNSSIFQLIAMMNDRIYCSLKITVTAPSSWESNLAIFRLLRSHDHFHRLLTNNWRQKMRNGKFRFRTQFPS